MQFPNKVRRVSLKQKTNLLLNETDSDYLNHPLHFYSTPPTGNLSLIEFETLALERFRVLKAVEKIGIQNSKNSQEYLDSMYKELNQLKKQNILPVLHKHYSPEKTTKEDFLERQKDNISHFILRLAFCRSEDLRRWFISQELDLFRYRFAQEDKKSIEIFLKNSGLNFSPIPENQKNDMLKELIACSRDLKGFNVDNQDFYKVPFTEAIDLVKNRRVYLSKGFAFVPHSDLITIIMSAFRTSLSHALTLMSRLLPSLEQDNRLLPMLNSLSKCYFGQDYQANKSTDKITSDMLDSLSRTSFPLCMQSIHQHIRNTHHAKHWSRMQYGLFLKGIGMTLDEAMKFWKTEFSKTIDPDKFDKQYAYNVRHSFGKEGKHADYTPYSCMKIIMSNTPGPGDNHGCPFKHSDADLLKQRLSGLKISKESSNEILELVKGHHYQLACGKYFECVHNTDNKFSPNHPNQYFEESQKMLKHPQTPAKVVKSVTIKPCSSDSAEIDKLLIEAMDSVNDC